MFKLIVSLAISVFCTHVSAAIQERDLIPNSDDGLISYDTVNNLEWLDLTYTNGRTVYEIQSNWGGLLDLGFRYATLSDLTKLFNSLGLEIGKNYTTAPYYADSSTIYSIEATSSIIDVIHKFGVLMTTDNAGVIQQEWTLGMYGLDQPDEYFRYSYLVINYQITSYINSSIYTAMSSNGAIKLGGGPMGSWLVRNVPSPVPEIDTWAMMLIGGFMALIVKKRRFNRY
ncbi:hypothetical protein [Methylophilus sp. 14]|uniref:hypothetical protein n=1 Tax=Methylophilus sp. 14 TaxID=2781019 RepID=UPI00188F73D2|nr:hypothetical protein [Methylophilus sp. 14]MBF4988139.1 hypothetical protein [Methylophilus sp. 14]